MTLSATKLKDGSSETFNRKQRAKQKLIFSTLIAFIFYLSIIVLLWRLPSEFEKKPQKNKRLTASEMNHRIQFQLKQFGFISNKFIKESKDSLQQVGLLNFKLKKQQKLLKNSIESLKIIKANLNKKQDKLVEITNKPLEVDDKYDFDRQILDMINWKQLGWRFRSKVMIWNKMTKPQYLRSFQMMTINHNVGFGGKVKVELKEGEDLEEKEKRVKAQISTQRKYYEKKYEISKYANKQLRFCIVVSTYNNVENRLNLRNLDSIFMQEYENYHVVYIDDASQQKDGEAAKDYVKRLGIPQDKIQIIINEVNSNNIVNYHNAANNYCQKNQIMMMVDGDDSLIGTQVLSLYNAVYQRENATCVYSNYVFIEKVNGETSIRGSHASREIPQENLEAGTFRKLKNFYTSHLKSFYVSIFRQIKKKDLCYPNGTFFDHASDVAIMTPIIEMSGTRIHYLRQFTYEYRGDKGSANKPWNQEFVSQIIFKKPPYSVITNLHLNSIASLDIPHQKDDETTQEVKQEEEYDQNAKRLLKKFGQSPELEGPTSKGDKQLEKLEYPNDLHEILNINDIQRKYQSTKESWKEISYEQYMQIFDLIFLTNRLSFDQQILSDCISENKCYSKEYLQDMVKSNKRYVEKKYQISEYLQKQLRFCVVISSYRNVANGLLERNLNSVFMQQYDNYYVVYLDDGSPESDGSHAQAYIKKNRIPESMFSLITHQKRKNSLENYYEVAHDHCQEGEIMVLLQGSDSLLGNQVFSLLNAVYQKHQAAVVYTLFINVQKIDGQLKIRSGKASRQIERDILQTGKIRSTKQFYSSHLKSFYVDLFRKIEVKDLKFENGTFFPQSSELAIMTPIIEMAGQRTHFLKEFTMQYRSDIQFNKRKWRINSVSNAVFQKRKPYQTLQNFDFLFNRNTQIQLTNPLY